MILLDVSALEIDEVFGRWYRIMPADRKRKIDAFRTERDRRLSLGAGILLHYTCSQAGMNAAALSCGPNGKPFFAGQEDLHFNLSHSGSLAACAVSNHPVGIDVEENTHFDEDLCRYVFQEPERAWVREAADRVRERCTALWTIKESLMKYWKYLVLVTVVEVFLN